MCKDKIISIRTHITDLLQKAERLEKDMQCTVLAKKRDQLKAVGQDYAQMQPLLLHARKIASTLDDLDALEMLVSQEEQDEGKEMLQEEHALLLNILMECWQAFQQEKILNLSSKETTVTSLFLEIRAGTGGEEASLFCADLFRMYQRYSQQQHWSLDVMSQSVSERGGYREVITRIRGKEAWKNLQYEAGVHRVQRVPVTESSGRVHTSTVTVAILPEPESMEDVPLPAKDIRIEVFRARGPGGQSVNTTDSAVRITHFETGITVSQQDEKSQHRNKAKAMAILRARLYEHKRQEQHREQSAKRSEQVGTGERSERIRTYNFPQGRVTDHRASLTVYQLEKIINGEYFEDFINNLQEKLTP